MASLESLELGCVGAVGQAFGCGTSNWPVGSDSFPLKYTLDDTDLSCLQLNNFCNLKSEDIDCLPSL
jgi:hypothetical protein